MKKYLTLSLTIFFVFLICNYCLSQNEIDKGLQKLQNYKPKEAILDFESYISKKQSKRNIITQSRVNRAYLHRATASLYICDFEKSKESYYDLLERVDNMDTVYISQKYIREIKSLGNYGLGLIAYYENNLQSAISYLNTAVKFNDENDLAVLLRAICYKELGDLSNAKKDFNSLKKRSKSKLIKAKISFYMNEKEEGIKQMTKIITTEPTVYNYYEFASLYAMSGDTINSIKYLDKSLKWGLFSYPLFIFYDKNFNNLRNTVSFNKLIKYYDFGIDIPLNSYLTKNIDSLNTTIAAKNINSSNTTVPTNTQKDLSYISQQKIIGSKITEEKIIVNNNPTAFEIQKNEETRKFLLNNNIYGSFIKGTNGLLYVNHENSLYKLSSITGDSWSKIADKVKNVSIDPDNSDIMYAINDKNRINKSVDGGTNWRIIENGLPNYITADYIVINPKNTNEIFLSTFNGLYVTKDAGFFWEPSLTGTYIKRIQFDYYKEHKYYMLDYSKNELLMIDETSEKVKIISNNLPTFLTQGSGRTAISKRVTINDFFFFSDKDTPFILVFTEEGIYKTENDGNDWKLISGDFNSNDTVISIYATENEIFLACEKRGRTESLEPALYVINCKEFICTKIDCKIDQGLLHGIAQDNNHQGLFYQLDKKIAYLDESFNSIGLNYGVTRHSEVYSINASEIDGKPVLFALVKNSNPIDVYNYGIWRSFNNGISWEGCLNYIPYPYRSSLDLRKILISPFNKNEIWVFDGEYNSFISEDYGVNWYNIKNKFNSQISGFIYSNSRVRDFAFDIQNPNILYATVGVNDYDLIRFDKRTIKSTKLHEAYNFKLGSDNTKMILTSKGDLSVDGGWTWKSIITKLDAKAHIGFDFNKNEIIPIDVQEKKIIVALKNVWSMYESVLAFANSEDEGNSWTRYSPIHNEVSNLFIDSQSPSNIFIAKKTKATQYGDYEGLEVYYSRNFGETWKLIFSLDSKNIGYFTTSETKIRNKRYLDDFVNDIFINDGMIYIALTNGLIYSNDFGKTWNKIGGIYENH
ncbi:MAG: hypothetical protein WCR58_07215 [Bacteroidales bacterium]|jgi:photosystem II stability/assembly factor-like uncharacterized protein/tetratricopeptide (TPR) repeat protein|nr:hypothetical protein [Bacteroidales bacterium]MDD3702025.1 hypothetical protein [Bacteroidales bacterium]